jgi:hypothetical protein
MVIVNAIQISVTFAKLHFVNILCAVRSFQILLFMQHNPVILPSINQRNH